MRLVVYTHSDYSFVWPYWKKQMDNFMESFEKIVFLNDESSKVYWDKYDIKTYPSSLSYRDRLLICLKKLNNEIILFCHEDMFLYSKPNYKILNEFENLVKSDLAHCIKLIRAGDYLVKSGIHDKLYKNPNDLKFAIQPTILKVNKFIELLESVPPSSIWELETRLFKSSIIDDDKTFFCYDNESKRGISHYNSNIYNYIATAVVKGKWNIAEYEKELKEIIGNDLQINMF